MSPWREMTKFHKWNCFIKLKFLKILKNKPTLLLFFFCCCWIDSTMGCDYFTYLERQCRLAKVYSYHNPLWGSWGRWCTSSHWILAPHTFFPFPDPPCTAVILFLVEKRGGGGRNFKMKRHVTRNKFPIEPPHFRFFFFTGSDGKFEPVE